MNLNFTTFINYTINTLLWSWTVQHACTGNMYLYVHYEHAQILMCDTLQNEIRQGTSGDLILKSTRESVIFSITGFITVSISQVVKMHRKYEGVMSVASV